MLDSGWSLEFLKFSVRVDDHGFWSGVQCIDKVRVTRSGNEGMVRGRKEATGQGSRCTCIYPVEAKILLAPSPADLETR